jgi:signal transduction histidine kinase
LTIEHLYKVRQELGQQVLKQEHERGALESKNAFMATLFHYVNNSAMVIYGRSQMMRANQKNGKKEKVLENLKRDLDVIDSSIQKIAAVLEEVKEITTADQDKLSGSTDAIDLDEKLAKRMNKMSRDQRWFSEATTQKIPV